MFLTFYGQQHDFYLKEKNESNTKKTGGTKQARLCVPEKVEQIRTSRLLEKGSNSQ